ncbi:zonular occludens toxin family protein [Roseateles sp. 22389]|uniref:zonular occludens toxin family protein n=1 Tax=Roseateles sp. 22389 TaxID=3453916 RepID=UPI003F85A948
MIIFHEGLPRSGKSYESLVRRIIPAIAAGRPVVAYVEGLNHEKIAELAGVTVDRCRELLTAITREQVPEIPELSKDNALIVLDEAQNFWGTSSKLSQSMTQFVTEHGHRGIDIVLMGQSIKDVNALWRRRVELKLCFLKLNGIGAGKRYSVTTWRHKGDDKYTKVGTVVSAYDVKYFGSYASHVSADTNTADYRESRATVFSSGLFKYGIPLAVAAAIWGAWTSWKFFHPEPVKPKQAGAVAAPGSAAASAPVVARAAVGAASTPVVEQRPRSAIEKHLSGLAGNRLRLAGLAKMGERVGGVVEWVSGDMRVMERMSLDSLRQLGVAVLVSGDTVQLAVGDWFGLATSWPLDGDIRVPEARLQQMREMAGVRGSPVAPSELRANVAANDSGAMPGALSVGPSRGGPSTGQGHTFGAR